MTFWYISLMPFSVQSSTQSVSILQKRELMVKSLLRASVRGVPISIWGILEFSSQLSDLRLTKSMLCPWILAVAVYRCLLSSGLNLVTPKLEIVQFLVYACFFSRVTNSSPFILSRVISISWDSLPMILIDVEVPYREPILRRLA